MITGPGLDEVSSVPAGSVASERGIENPSVPISPAQLAELLTGGPSNSGKLVAPRTAIRVSAVYACVRIIASAIARMPLILLEHSEKGKTHAKQHPLYRILRRRPNRNMGSFVMRQSHVANALLWGNGYAEIVRRGDGTPYEAIPIESERVTPFMQNGLIRYRVRNLDGSMADIPGRDMLHIPGMCFDGLIGLSVVAYARQTIGAAMAADEFSASILRNGLRPAGVLNHPGRLGKEAAQNLRESFQATYSGSSNGARPLILEEKMTWTPHAMPLEDAQFVESQQFRVEEICRWYGVPPHKVQHMLHVPANSVEQMNLDFLGDTLSPWIAVIEEEYTEKLLTPTEQDSMEIKHDTSAIVQLDSAAKSKLYQTFWGVGAMSADDILDREGLNHVAEDRGRVYFVPSNMMPAPKPDQADKLLEAWISKGSGQGKTPGEPNDKGGAPEPETDDKVAQAG